MVLAAIFSPAGLFAQAGMKFNELAKRLDPYFDKVLINDLQTQLPQGTEYSIWGWDVGDFSGDGNNDVALSVRLAGERKKIVQVFLFVDIDGYLTKIGQIPFEYVEMPLEIGVAIKNNTCFATKKNRQFDWIIRGFSFDNGSLIMRDEFSTCRIGELTYESYRDFLTLKNTDKYVYTKNNKEKFSADYMTIPSYPRGRLIYKGYSSKAVSKSIDYVHKGAFFWNGDKDCSFKASSAYDDEYIYMTVDVTDDAIVSAKCDTCPGDRVEVWIDALDHSNGDRFTAKKNDDVRFLAPTDSGIFKFTILPGNFTDLPASVKLLTNNKLDPAKKIALKSVKAVSELKEDSTGYVVKFRIPFVLLGTKSRLSQKNGMQEYGCTIVVNDCDNEFRPEENTEIASSKFVPSSPTSYGSLLLVPNDEWSGQTNNIYREDILKYVLEYGF